MHLLADSLDSGLIGKQIDIVTCYGNTFQPEKALLTHPKGESNLILLLMQHFWYLFVINLRVKLN